jgi:Fe-S oxidoreductase
MLPTAIQTIDRTLADFLPHIDDPQVVGVLVCEPSCLSAIKDDWLQLRLATPLEIRRRLAAKSMLVEDFVHRRWNEHPIKPSIPATSGPPVFLHGHCHQKALWGDETSAAAVRRFAGDRLTVIPSGCCGMAGSFGFTADHFDLSQRIGELSLFPPIRRAPPGSIFLAPGASCRHQIQDATAHRALHPIQWIAGQLPR